MKKAIMLLIVLKMINLKTSTIYYCLAYFTKLSEEYKYKIKCGIVSSFSVSRDFILEIHQTTNQIKGNMGVLEVLSVCALISFGLISCEVSNEKKYTTKYDNIDLDEIIHNERLLKNYVDCLLEKGRCTPDGLELKKNMPDAIATDCSKCSEKQKEGSEVMMRYLIDNKPEYWKPLQEKYDPSGSYKKRYLESKGKDVSVEPVTESNEHN